MKRKQSNKNDIKSILCILVLLLSIVFVPGSGCSTGADDKEDSFQSEGKILGGDARSCICHCGGYFIEIEEERYRFDQRELPENDLDLSSANLPLFVKLDWELIEPDSECDATDRIKVLRIKEK